MTKKDYIQLATAIGQATKELKAGDSARKAVEIVIEHISHACQIENPMFNPATFKAYIAKITKS